MKLIFVVIDGMGGLPVKELDDQTTLEAAYTPNMDMLADKGRTGLMYTVKRGIAPESDVAVISILGYDPFKYNVSRGPIEALGAGLEFNDGYLALRCNFATMSPDGRIIDRRAGRDLTAEEARILADAVNREVKLESYPATFEFKSTFGHRGALIIKSDTIKLSGEITNTDPAYERVSGLGVVKEDAEAMLEKCKPLVDTESAKASACLVNEFVEKSHLILEDHEVNRRREAEGRLKANVILTRDAGSILPRFPYINKKYNVKFASFVDMPVERGIAKLAGMSIISMPPPSGNLKADYTLRVERLIENIQGYDCFYIHIKGPDEPGHDGNFKLKKEIIESVDRFFFGTLLERIDLKETVICVTADHSTPCILKAHSDDPVPLLISGGRTGRDAVNRFSEAACREGALGVLERGTMLMPILIDALRR